MYLANDEVNLEISGGTITSNNIGIQLSATNGSYNKLMTITGGTVYGGTYGVYMNENHTINVGTVDDDESQTIPLITGGNYGIYKTKGTVNFNNGRLRGKTDGYYGEFYGTRDGYDIASTKALIEKNIPVATVSTTEYSDTATTNTPKRGNGHARFTFLDEDTGVCAKNEVYNYEYKGDNCILEFQEKQLLIISDDNKNLIKIAENILNVIKYQFLVI